MKKSSKARIGLRHFKFIQKFGKSRRAVREYSKERLDQLEACADDSARRLLLGVSIKEKESEL